MTSPSSSSRHLAVMPASGAGTRVGADVPKQYLALDGEPMIRRAARALLAAAWIEHLLVVVAPDDERAAAALAGLSRTSILAQGGPTRRDTVLAGLRALGRAFALQSGFESIPRANTDDWVLVHDAARPGLDLASLTRLRDSLVRDRVGGLLALPVGDTVKRAATDRAGPVQARVGQARAGIATMATVAAPVEAGLPSVLSTVPRDDLWLAQTPQMFRFGLLLDALERFQDVTDEASAIEHAGHAPRLIPGSRANFKVTNREDLEVMRRLLLQTKSGAIG